MASKLVLYRDYAVSMLHLAFGRLWPSLTVPPSDLSGKVAIITGGNSGIGLQIALDIAKQGTTVYLACRNVFKANEAAAQINSAVPSSRGRVHVLSINTSSLSSVREMVETVKNLNVEIDLLFHNAGIGSSPNGEHFTPEGFPWLYATNFLGSFLLTHLLEPYLASDARVIFTTSSGHYAALFSSMFSIEAVKDRIEPGFHIPSVPLDATTSVPDSDAYCYTKSMQVAFANLLQSHFDRAARQSGKHQRRIAHAFDPGFTLTPFFTKFSASSMWQDPLYWILRSTTALALDVSQGAATAVWLAGTQDKTVVGAGNGGACWLRMSRQVSKIDLLDQATLERLWLRWEADSGVEWR